MQDATFLFTDIEGSTRLWEEQPERMRPALARHDALVRELVERHGGRVVKMTGDGVHAAFEDALDALTATLKILCGVAALGTDIELRLRCGLHAGPSESRDGDFFGSVVNRAARVMSAAHGGQALVTEAVVQRLERPLPDGSSLRDLGAVRLRDLARPERIFQLVHPALRGQFPALRSLEDTPNNLPLQLSSFVGREREIVQLRELLVAQRLVTVVGLGGLGKTRLALHAAAESLGAQPDGAWLVELAPVQDSRWVAQAIATTLGVKEDSGHSIEEALVRHLKDRALLVVLDNCEHLLEAAAALARKLLSASPGLRLLATSREPLRIPGETLFPLGGLPVPGPRVALSAEAVGSFESVRLFVDRATAAQPDFRISEDNAALIAAICHRLDGIPLAIELAAARVRSVPLTQIATRLKDRFKLLTSGDSTALPRQRTLRATIDWSHELLPEEERMVFRRLAAFAGGWSLDAAERLCADEGRPDDMLDLLSRLVEKSLVTMREREDRYEMLETVRQYAFGQLEAAGEATLLRDRHFEHFADLAITAKPHLAGPAQSEWLGRLDLERENLLAAHEWAAHDERHAQQGLALASGLKQYWLKRGLLELGSRVTQEALERPGASAPTMARAQALFTAGQIRYFMGSHDAASALLSESLAIARSLRANKGVAAVLQPLGMATMAKGDFPLARACFEEAARLAAADGDQAALAGAWTGQGHLRRIEGDFKAAEASYRQVLDAATASGDPEALAIAQLNLAMLHVLLGQAAPAIRLLGQAFRISQETGSSRLHQCVIEASAGVAGADGMPELAAELLACAALHAENNSLRPDPADEIFLAEVLRTARAALDGAVFDSATSRGAATSIPAALKAVETYLLGRPAMAPAREGSLTSR